MANLSHFTCTCTRSLTIEEHDYNWINFNVQTAVAIGVYITYIIVARDINAILEYYDWVFLMTI
jgi:hypothetical protein